jgi:transcriptional regulator with XRE-family HTH domain
MLAIYEKHMVNVKRSNKATARTREIGIRLRELREHRGLPLGDAARRLDPPVTFQTLAKWESGALGITIDRIEQLCKIYRVKPGVLLGYK